MQWRVPRGCWHGWACRPGRTICPASCPGAKSSELPFADEPTGNLDSENGKIVLAQLIDLKNEHGATLVLVTHNPEIARVADRVIALKDGHLTG